MINKMRTKIRWLGLFCLLVAGCVNLIIVGAVDASATSEITIGGMNSSYNATLSQEGGVPGANYFRVPVSISITDMDQYAVGIYLDCDNNSTLNSTQIATCNSNAALIGSKSGSMSVVSGATTLEQMNNEWGFYYDTSKTAEGSTIDPTATIYSGMGTSPSTMAEVIGLTATNTSNSATEDFSLVFGAKASGNLPAGAYSGNIVVAVTATPIEVATVITKFSDLRNMQDMNPALCADAEIGDVTNLKDTRDGKYYVVGKLADGRCWMLQNLALEGGKTIYLGDSNISASSYTLPTTAPTGVNSSYWVDSTNTTGWMYNGYHANTGSLEASYIANVKDEAPTTNAAPATSTPKVNTGAYYSYMVATAGTGTSTTEYDKAPSSICPKGWHLPAGGDVKANGNGEFQTLYDAYSSDGRGQAAGFNDDFRVAATGICDANACPSADGFGNYWSSTIAGLSSNHYRGFTLISKGSSVNPASNTSKMAGYSVRCVADNTMQSMTADACGALEEGDTLNLMDARDAKYYVVGKLADGNCWMLQNLALEGGKTIYSTDSNITASSYMLPSSAPTGRSSSYWIDNNNTTEYMYDGYHINTGSLEASYIASVMDAAPTSNINPATNNVSTGAYYSYMVATAGTGTSNIMYDKASSSICPKNWHLPTGSHQKTNGNGEFQTLYEAYDGNVADFNNAFRYAATGSCYTGGCPSSDSSARYWSSTLFSATVAYFLYATNSNVNPINDNGTTGGLSVRCMLTAAS